jgi:hypothetical protein
MKIKSFGGDTTFQAHPKIIPNPFFIGNYSQSLLEMVES